MCAPWNGPRCVTFEQLLHSLFQTFAQIVRLLVPPSALSSLATKELACAERVTLPGSISKPSFTAQSILVFGTGHDRIDTLDSYSV